MPPPTTTTCGGGGSGGSGGHGHRLANPRTQLQLGGTAATWACVTVPEKGRSRPRDRRCCDETHQARFAPTRRLRAAAAVLLLGALVAGCSGGSESMSADSGGAVAQDGARRARPGVDGHRGARRRRQRADPRRPHRGADPGGDQRPAVSRWSARTSTSSAARSTTCCSAVGGTIDNEQTSHDRKGEVERSVLVLRVPVDEFAAVMTALEDLGTMRLSDSHVQGRDHRGHRRRASACRRCRTASTGSSGSSGRRRTSTT